MALGKSGLYGNTDMVVGTTWRYRTCWLSAFCYVQLSPRRSFQLKRGVEGDASLIEAAASVAWQNLDLYTSEQLDQLPVDLVQRLLNKCIEAGKLQLPTLCKFAHQPLYHLDLSSVIDVTDEWLLVVREFSLHHLSLSCCSAVRPGMAAFPDTCMSQGTHAPLRR